MTTPPEDFAALARDRLLRQRGDADIEINGDRLLVQIPGQPPQALGLHNLWRSIEAFRDTPQSLTGAIDEWARTVVEPLETPPSADSLATSLRLVVRPKEVVAEMVEQGQEIPAWSVVPGMAVLLVADTERAMRFLDVDAVAATGLEPPEAFQRALDNLREAIDEKLERHGHGLVMYTCGGHYEASLVLFDTLWDAQEAEVGGPLLVAIPARDLCMSAPAADPDAVAALEAAVRDAFEREVPYLLSPYLYTREKGRWCIERSAQPEASDHVLLTAHADDLAALSPDGVDPQVAGFAPGLFAGLSRPGGATFVHVADDAREAAWNHAVRARLINRRSALETGPDGVTSLTDEAGPPIDLALHTHALDKLGDDLVVGFPSRGQVLAAPSANVDALRRRVVTAYDEAGDERLTTCLFTEDEQGWHAWPAEAPCRNCDARRSTDAVLCWRCGDAVLESQHTRWMGESFALAAALSAALWLGGGLTHWNSLLLIWGLVFFFLWPLRAQLHGATRTQAYAVWIPGLYGWLIPSLTLFGIWRVVQMSSVWVEAWADPHAATAPLVVGAALLVSLPLGLVALCVDIARTLGPTALVPWTPTTHRRT